MTERQYFNLYIQDVVDKGRGVFTEDFIPARAVVETCPVIVIDPSEVEFFSESRSLSDYLFQWAENGLALALGYGGLYNHSEDPNLAETREFDHRMIIFRARRDIQPEEELTIQYRIVWFSWHP